MNTCLTFQSCCRTCTSPVFQKSVKENCPGKESSDPEEDAGKVGNALWCSCGKCKPMATHAESICSLDKYEIRESYFKGILSFVFEILLCSKLLVKEDVITQLC